MLEQPTQVTRAGIALAVELDLPTASHGRSLLRLRAGHLGSSRCIFRVAIGRIRRVELADEIYWFSDLFGNASGSLDAMLAGNLVQYSRARAQIVRHPKMITQLLLLLEDYPSLRRRAVR